MNSRLIHLAVAAAIVAAPMGAFALGTNEKGCLVGGAVGGVAGHAMKGEHTLLGAAAGCGVGILVNKERVKKNDQIADSKKKQRVAYSAGRRDERDTQRDVRQSSTR
jgi:hypothetical protein